MFVWLVTEERAPDEQLGALAVGMIEVYHELLFELPVEPEE